MFQITLTSRNSIFIMSIMASSWVLEISWSAMIWPQRTLPPQTRLAYQLPRSAVLLQPLPVCLRRALVQDCCWGGTWSMLTSAGGKLKCICEVFHQLEDTWWLVLISSEQWSPVWCPDGAEYLHSAPPLHSKDGVFVPRWAVWGLTRSQLQTLNPVNGAQSDGHKDGQSNQLMSLRMNLCFLPSKWLLHFSKSAKPSSGRVCPRRSSSSSSPRPWWGCLISSSGCVIMNEAVSRPSVWKTRSFINTSFTKQMWSSERKNQNQDTSQAFLQPRFQFTLEQLFPSPKTTTTMKTTAAMMNSEGNTRSNCLQSADWERKQLKAGSPTNKQRLKAAKIKHLKEEIQVLKMILIVYDFGSLSSEKEGLCVKIIS